MDFEVHYSQKFTTQNVNISLTGSHRVDSQVPEWETETVCDVYYEFEPDWGTYTLSLNIHTTFDTKGYAYDLRVGDSVNDSLGQYYCTTYDSQYYSKDTTLTDAALNGIFTVTHKVASKWAYATLVRVISPSNSSVDSKINIPIEWSGNIGSIYVEF